MVLVYLDNKAKESRVTALKTVEAYATATELARKLKVRLDTVCQALDSLVSQNRVRTYPNGRKRNRYYGSLILPIITGEEILSASRALLEK